jgi:hypothetical protein
MATRIMYALVEASSTDGLIKKVIEWLERGWKPQGGMTVTPDGKTFIQPVTQEVELKEE